MRGASIWGGNAAVRGLGAVSERARLLCAGGAAGRGGRQAGAAQRAMAEQALKHTKKNNVVSSRKKILHLLI